MARLHLTDPLHFHFRLTQAQTNALRKLGISSVRDLLYHLPSRYSVGGGEAQVMLLAAGQSASVIGTLQKLETKKSWKRRIPISEGYLQDSSGRIKLRFFHQPYIAKMYAEGSLVRATGKVAGTGDKLYLANPELQKVSAAEAGLFEQGSTLLNGARSNLD